MEDPKISSVTFTGYKAFKNSQNLEIRPLTILFGYNNSGKSAVVRLLPMLSASYSTRKLDTLIKSYIDYRAPCLRGALFKHIAYAAGDRMNFGLQWEDGESISFELQQQGSDEEKINSITFTERQENDLVSSEYIEDAYSEEKSSQYELRVDRSKKVNLNGLNVFETSSKSPIHPSITLKLKKFSESVFWLNSVRIAPPREFAINSGTSAKINFDGSGTAETIWKMSKSNSIALTYINQWLIDTCGRAIDIGLLSESSSTVGTVCRLETVPVAKHDNVAPIRIPILDSGEGIAQALPVVTLCAQAACGELGENPIIMLEQPELHLHPRAVVTLANFLIFCIKENARASFVIETHSESLLIAMQTALASSTLALKDLCTYWVSKDAEQGSALDKIEFDDQGYILQNFPNEVFQEVYEQAKTLIEVRDRQE
ncbi:AAA family ATPase [Pseudomonas fragariae (ex Marin et al. 2024)]|uniref:AAA family ATPase n=1 Tax=Pseudomonas fragariae (ex Marin et al. 2024) TaxID=3080056 RepID=UPI003F792FB2